MVLSQNYSNNTPQEHQFSEKCKRVAMSIAESKVPLKRKIKALAQLHKLPLPSQPFQFSNTPLEIRELEEEDLQESFEDRAQQCGEPLVPKQTKLMAAANGNPLSMSKDRQKSLRM